MRFFDRLFGNVTEDVPQPNITFGRYSDSYKSKKQYAAWEESLDLFERQEYLPLFFLFSPI